MKLLLNSFVHEMNKRLLEFKRAGLGCCLWITMVRIQPWILSSFAKSFYYPGLVYSTYHTFMPAARWQVFPMLKALFPENQ
jgi:hypothetical protein